MRSVVLAAAAAAVVLPLSSLACSAAPATDSQPAGQQSGRLPDLQVTPVAGGLDHPWDVVSIGGGRYLVSERDRRDLVLIDDDGTQPVDFPSDTVWAAGETGLMGLAVDPDFADNGRFYACGGGTKPNGKHDVRVVAYRLNEDATAATRVENLLTGLPYSTGRHGGCQLLTSASGALIVGTGDSATTGVPRNKDSLGGKTLRLDPSTGKPWPGNPFIKGSGNRRYVLTYGHRNVQGLAQRSDGTLWSVEQGTYRDDEVNRLRSGGDYGWQPGPGYDESPPMTDQSLPGRQIEARWSSGDPTVATSGADFVPESGWGRLSGALAVGVLKDEELLFVQLDKSGHLDFTRTPAELDGDFGRLRGVTAIPGGDLLVTTDNGNGNDRVLRVSPS